MYPLIHSILVSPENDIDTVIDTSLELVRCCFPYPMYHCHMSSSLIHSHFVNVKISEGNVSIIHKFKEWSKEQAQYSEKNLNLVAWSISLGRHQIV